MKGPVSWRGLDENLYTLDDELLVRIEDHKIPDELLSKIAAHGKFVDYVKYGKYEIPNPPSKEVATAVLHSIGIGKKQEPKYYMPRTDDEKFYGFSFDISHGKLGVVKRAIFNAPATIVFWADGSKTVVKCGPNDTYDPEKGFVMCFMKRFFGNDNRFHKMLKIAHKEIEKTTYLKGEQQ